LRAPGFHTVTLGCKLNQFDTAAIAGELTRRGYVEADDPAAADVVVVNTCTVTGKADADARGAVRQIRRRNRDCVLLVTGCYAEWNAQALRALSGVDRVFGNTDKLRVAEILDELGLAPRRGEGAAGSTDLRDRGCDADSAVLPEAVHFGERSRAFLKIQEGCDLRCSYCVIPRVRGASRSVAPDRVHAALDSLLAAGFREIVLTGVNTGDYGRDLNPPTSLEALLRTLLARCGPNRVRLNSLEPRTVTDGIVDLMAGEPRLARHLQIPLQSGSDAILRAMRRNYRASTYRARLARLSELVPRVGLGADVIVGFPGETDAHFRDTVSLIEDSPLAYLHVFAWSPRPQTAAAQRPGRVHGAVVRERSTRLRELGERLGLAFRRRLLGTTLDAVVLDPGSQSAPGRALTGNFVEVEISGGSATRGSLVDVEITGVHPDRTTARVLGVPPWATGYARPTAPL